MSRVYVVQKQFKQDTGGNLVPKFDLSTAEKYGELVFLLGPTAGPFNSKSVISELKEKLEDYTPDDYLLLLGNPCLIGWAAIVANAKAGGKMNLLQWSGKEQRYVVIRSDLQNS